MGVGMGFDGITRQDLYIMSRPAKYMVFGSSWQGLEMVTMNQPCASIKSEMKDIYIALLQLTAYYIFEM
ncbi:hypothetical protein I7I53_03850 [Histoplasma capsulatum var. duboisii H88]|uniref:Uncharacterized protein n=1 Tax=Ajellomyces capsulatus (strain H88) TaxID=544711 RepID=A0A8A1LTV9_AJEC8|nr:hypothetical protein I7I53_03850 [Histoplasma capsulatum var. duboisii H88]